MKQSSIYLSVVIPAYNEEKRITKTIKIISSYLTKQPYTYEIIVVGDGPTDNTPNVVKNLTASISHLSYIDRKKNKGKGYTVREGILRAHGRIRLFTDADNSTDISHFDKMRPLFDKGKDIVISSRNPKDAKGAKQAVSQALHKRILGTLGNLLIQKLAVPGIWDTQNGFKAFRDYAANNIFSRAKIDGWGFDIEVLALARRLNYKVGIIPVNWINDPISHVKFSSYFKVLLEAFKVRRNLISNKYEI